MTGAIEPSGCAVAVPQPHGGVLRPWQPGTSGNPGGASKATREAVRLAKEASPDAMRTLIAIMGDPAEDSRARIVAAAHVLDRALGKPKDAPPAEDAPKAVDLASLSAAEREELAIALGVVRRLAGRAQGVG